MKKTYAFLLLALTALCFAQPQQDSLKIESLLKKAGEQQNKLKYPDAFRTFTQALQLAKKSGNKVLEFKTGVAIGNFHIMNGELKLAQAFFENQFPTAGIPIDIRSYYYHRKAFYFNQDLKLDSALVTAKRGVRIATQAQLTADLITLYNEIGYIYERQGRFGLSLGYYDRVLALTKNNLEVHSSAYLKKARVFYVLKRYAASVRMLEDNAHQVDSTDWHRTKSYIYDMLALNYKQLGDSTNYYKNLFRRTDEDLKTHHEISLTQYNDLLLKYQTKEKDALLSESKSDEKRLVYLIIGLFGLILLAIPLLIFIRKKNRKLNKLLQKNSFLLGELNHRTKNNLQLIVSLTARETNKTSHTEITGLTNLASKIESIASLHKQLYLNDELKSVRSKPYIEEIIASIEPFLKNNGIGIETDIDDVAIDSNQSLYIGLIINELFVNSIKHAFAGRSDKHISIAVKSERKQLEIRYADNGTGIAEGTRIKLLNTLSEQLEADFHTGNRDGFYYSAKIKIQ